MKLENSLICLLVAMSPFLGCKKTGDARATPPALDELLPQQAQPRLPTLKLWLGAEEVIAELALTPEQLRTGMMFRTNMAENEAMLFVFPAPHRASFWMKNTRLPLTAAYIDPAGLILEIHDLQPHDTNSLTAASENVQFVLETAQGWFQRHNVSTGAVVRTERGPLADAFSRRVR